MKLIASNSDCSLLLLIIREFVACKTGALLAKRGERGILSEALDEGRKLPRSPRLAHKAPVMQARNLPSNTCSTENNIPFPLFHSCGILQSATKFFAVKSKTFKRLRSG